MSKDVATIGASGEVINIAVQSDDYEPQPYEVVVTGPAWIGGDYVGGCFYAPQPFPSWTRSNGEWQAPIPHPNNGIFIWNENTQEWQKPEPF